MSAEQASRGRAERELSPGEAGPGKAVSGNSSMDAPTLSPLGRAATNVVTAPRYSPLGEPVKQLTRSSELHDMEINRGPLLAYGTLSMALMSLRLDGEAHAMNTELDCGMAEQNV